MREPGVLSPSQGPTLLGLCVLWGPLSGSRGHGQGRGGALVPLEEEQRDQALSQPPAFLHLCPHFNLEL